MAYKIGDTVRVRQWDDMAAEFGLDVFGSIDCPYKFVKEMRCFCGGTYVIDSIVYCGGESGPRAYWLEGDDFNWKFTEDMFEKQDLKANIEPCSEEELVTFIGSLFGGE